MKSNNKRGFSRRNFVKTTASGAAALTILPSFTVSGLGHVAPSDKLLIAASKPDTGSWLLKKVKTVSG
jgi:hypothetical protein